MKRNSRVGFTLIELLIVVAIIAILAAIAVPNFLEAQVRAKVSRCQADMRSLTLALESYRVDSNGYPPGYTSWSGGAWDPLVILTTPISYFTSVPKDPFFLVNVYNDEEKGPGPYWYWQIPSDDPNFGLQAGTVRNKAWRLAGAGPDKLHSFGGKFNGRWTVYEINWIDYDPTNGTVSVGELMKWGP